MQRRRQEVRNKKQLSQTPEGLKNETHFSKLQGYFGRKLGKVLRKLRKNLRKFQGILKMFKRNSGKFRKKFDTQVLSKKSLKISKESLKNLQ